MMTVHVPELYCPVESRISIYVAQAEIEVNNWVRYYRLADDAAMERYQGERFVHMTARFYPFIAPEQLVILSQLYTLLFIADDDLDHVENFKNAAYLKAFVTDFMSILTHDQYFSLKNGNAVLAAFSDLWKRMKTLSIPEWRAQFIEGITQMYKAAFWENANISSGQHISLEDYMLQRQYLGAANVATDCIEFAYPILRLSRQTKDDPLIKKMTELSRNTVCWANDLFSLGKEFEHGGVHNLVLLIQKEGNFSLKSAISRAVKIHDRDVQLFYTLWQEAITRDDLEGHHIQIYIEGLATFMKGNIDWSVMDTARYYNFSYARGRVLKPSFLLQSHQQ